MVRQPIVIRNAHDLAAAIERADELMGCTSDSDEERELAAIADAIDDYIRDIVGVLTTAQNDNDPSTP